MAWQKVQFQLTSVCPMLMHNGRSANPLDKFAKAMKQISSKRAKTDSDYEELAKVEFFASLYMDKDGPVIPANMIDALLINASKKSKEGQLAKSGVFCFEHASLQYDGPRTADELWALDEFRFAALVRVGSARVVRMRPTFKDWSATLTINVEPSIVNPSRLIDWFAVAGSVIGVGDWRPRYGRFEAKCLV